MRSGSIPISLAVVMMLFAKSLPAAESLISETEIRAMTTSGTADAIALYREFLSQRNDANNQDDIARLVDWMDPQFRSLGFQVRRIDTPGSPVLLATRENPGADKTALIYLQADGQPVDPSAWDQDDPFDPVLKEKDDDGNWQTIPWSRAGDRIDPDWRVFARSASDSKGPMTQFISAMKLLNDASVSPAFNLKVIVDSEEELGSPNLAAVLDEHRGLFSADLLLIFDGPPHASNKPTVAFGARGMTTVTLVSWGPLTPQHSGHYGNFMPNPALHLARILASMKSADGRVLINGFYDGVELSDDVRALLDAVPDDEDEILAAVGLSKADAVAPTLQESLQYPSLNIRGMRSAWVGAESRTIIPSSAIAELDIRLVKESDPKYLTGLLRKHISNLGYAVLDHEPTLDERMRFDRIVTMTSDMNYAAFRSDFDSIAGEIARGGMRNLYGEEPILIRTMGGSIPISPFVDILGVPAATVPTVNIDNNQHSPNENLRMGNFVEGISIILSVLTQVPE